jgi:hypothetical protein
MSSRPAKTATNTAIRSATRAAALGLGLFALAVYIGYIAWIGVFF